MREEVATPNFRSLKRLRKFRSDVTQDRISSSVAIPQGFGPHGCRSSRCRAAALQNAPVCDAAVPQHAKRLPFASHPAGGAAKDSRLTWLRPTTAQSPPVCPASVWRHSRRLSFATLPSRSVANDSRARQIRADARHTALIPRDLFRRSPARCPIGDRPHAAYLEQPRKQSLDPSVGNFLSSR
jgi:hypothetical protein